MSLSPERQPSPLGVDALSPEEDVVVVPEEIEVGNFITPPSPIGSLESAMLLSAFDKPHPFDKPHLLPSPLTFSGHHFVLDEEIEKEEIPELAKTPPAHIGSLFPDQSSTFISSLSLSPSTNDSFLSSSAPDSSTHKFSISTMISRTKETGNFHGQPLTYQQKNYFSKHSVSVNTYMPSSTVIGSHMEISEHEEFLMGMGGMDDIETSMDALEITQPSHSSLPSAAFPPQQQLYHSPFEDFTSPASLGFFGSPTHSAGQSPADARGPIYHQVNRIDPEESLYSTSAPSRYQYQQNSSMLTYNHDQMINPAQSPPSYNQYLSPAQPSSSAPIPTQNANNSMGNGGNGGATAVSPSNSNQFGEHPFGEHPSRTLFVRNINSNVEDDELRSLFEAYGPLRSMYTQCKNRGFVMISYYDIRHAKSALRQLQHKVLRRRKLDIHYSIPKDNPSEKDQNQGTLVVFNLDSTITNDELRGLFGRYGEIKEIRETPNKKHHKFIEFYDVRDAERAMKNLNRTEVRSKKIKIEPSRPGGTRKAMMYPAPSSGTSSHGNNTNMQQPNLRSPGRRKLMNSAEDHSGVPGMSNYALYGHGMSYTAEDVIDYENYISQSFPPPVRDPSDPSNGNYFPRSVAAHQPGFPQQQQVQQSEHYLSSPPSSHPSNQWQQ